MLAQVHSPEALDPVELDVYLQQGWFRMGQTIFTTNFLSFSSQLYSAIWLRVFLPQFHGGKTREKLGKLNAGFRTEIQRASIIPDQENLFAQYRKSVSFEASSSLYQLLYGKRAVNVYNTYEVNLFEDDKLIACGFFDLGAGSAAGITSFYDPAYKKYSLGKYLIYLKMDFCKELGYQYFYPGYFVPGYSFFDYKLSIGTKSLQFLQLASAQWKPIGEFNEAQTPLNMMKKMLQELKELLLQSTIKCWIWEYGFFDANLIPELAGRDFFDFPVFLCFSGSVEDFINQVIVYDVRDRNYHLIKCTAVWKTNSAGGSNNVYSSHVLKTEDVLFSTTMPAELAGLILLTLEHQKKNTGQ